MLNADIFQTAASKDSLFNHVEQRKIIRADRDFHLGFSFQVPLKLFAASGLLSPVSSAENEMTSICCTDWRAHLFLRASLLYDHLRFFECDAVLSAPWTAIIPHHLKLQLLYIFQCEEVFSVIRFSYEIKTAQKPETI